MGGRVRLRADEPACERAGVVVTVDGLASPIVMILGAIEREGVCPKDIPLLRSIWGRFCRRSYNGDLLTIIYTLKFCHVINNTE